MVWVYWPEYLPGYVPTHGSSIVVPVLDRVERREDLDSLDRVATRSEVIVLR